MNREVVIEIADKFRSAVRRGGNLHLEPRHVAALLDAGFYEMVAALESVAMGRQCENGTKSGISSADTGSTSAPTPDSGPSAGSTPPPLGNPLPTVGAVEPSRGARLRVLAAVRPKARQPQRSTH